MTEPKKQNNTDFMGAVINVTSAFIFATLIIELLKIIGILSGFMVSTVLFVIGYIISYEALKKIRDRYKPHVEVLLLFSLLGLYFVVYASTHSIPS